LNPEGRRQARALARSLRTERPIRIYTSTLRRARDTAQVIAKDLGLKPLADERLNEISFGKWEGAYYRRLPKKAGVPFQRWREGKLESPPGGESIASLGRRVGQFLKELIRRHSGETVAVVAHGGPIKMFLFKVLKVKSHSIWSFRIDPASISLIEGDEKLLQIVWTNQTQHLNPFHSQ
jgi:broad specificity phosphatase PhoE